MRVSLKWLREYVDITISPEELAERLTQAGLAVDSIERTGAEWGDEIRAGLVQKVESHPNADRLRLVTVDTGAGSQRVVCGAPNVAEGQKIVFGQVGAAYRDGHSGKLGRLKAGVIRGVESAGMVMSEYELGLSDDHEGILVLPDDTPVGERLADLLGDTSFELSITPNRPDWLSVLGVAREVAAVTGAQVREPSIEFDASGDPVDGACSVDIADPDLCRRYVGTVIRDVKIGPSPGWMQKRLISAGQRPINNIVDVTNYVMLEIGQPLHAFDYDRVAGHHIIVRRARPGENFTTLDNIERALSDDMLVIADESRAVALAGVIGGLDSEVTDNTTNILLEAANFAGSNIRRTSTALKVRTEASTRFEKGLPQELVMLGSRRATKLLVEVCGGTALRGAVDRYPVKQEPVRVDVTRDRIVKVLGIDPSRDKVTTALEGLGFAVEAADGRYAATAPYWRTDVHIDDDVCEEIARIIGYDQIPALPLAGPIPEHVSQPLRELRERVRDVLATAGMRETISYAMTTMEALERVMPKETLAIYPPFKVVNPISSEHEYLRPTLRASLLMTLASNLRYQKAEVAIFETARTYERRDEQPPESGRPLGHEALPQEREAVCGVVTGRRLDRWGRPSDDPIDFFDAKAYVERLLSELGIAATISSTDEFGMVPGRAAAIAVGDVRIGVLGQIHPDVCAGFEIEQEVYLFEMVLDDALPFSSATRKATSVSRFPAVEQDLALIVDADTPSGSLRAAIEASALVREARVFDVYMGDQIPEGKKSLAFAVLYQSDERTLTDEDVAKAQRKIVERLKREFGAELRGSSR